MCNLKDQIFTPNALIGSGSLLRSLTQAKSKSGFDAKPSGSHVGEIVLADTFAARWPASAPSLGPLALIYEDEFYKH